MKCYFINWIIKDNDDGWHESEKSFPLDRALHLVDVGNTWFKRAEHELGKQDIGGNYLHEDYEKDELFINRYYGKQEVLL